MRNKEGKWQNIQSETSRAVAYCAVYLNFKSFSKDSCVFPTAKIVINHVAQIRVEPFQMALSVFVRKNTYYLASCWMEKYCACHLL